MFPQDVLYGSEQQAFLCLANLVEGTYLFQLRVTDTQGRSSTATATVEVQPGRCVYVCVFSDCVSPRTMTSIRRKS